MSHPHITYPTTPTLSINHLCLVSYHNSLLACAPPPFSPSASFTSNLHSQPGSQSAFGAIGGYCVPSFSTFGSQVHQDSLGSLSMTMGTCWPQPHQEVFSRRGVSLVIQGREEEERWGLGTAGGAGSALAHFGGWWFVEFGEII